MIKFDIDGVVDYFFQELIEEGCVPTEKEVDIIVDIAVNWVCQILAALDVEVIFEGEEE